MGAIKIILQIGAYLAIFANAGFSQPLALPAPIISTAEEIHNYLSQFITTGEKLALLLDFDGTLAAINPNPLFTSIDPESERVLHLLAKNSNIFIAIISGRRAPDVKRRVGIENITYSGNHGLEISFANQTNYFYPVGDELLTNCTNLRKALAKVALDGAWVEDKLVSLTYHYRHVPAELKEAYTAEARNLIKYYGFKAVQAHDAIEIKPPVVWSKGDAAKVILREEFGENWATNNLKVLFVGDDNSDEDVMKNVKGKGICFRVSDTTDIQTHADYLLPSTTTVTLLLEWLKNNL